MGFAEDDRNLTDKMAGVESDRGENDNKNGILIQDTEKKMHATVKI